MIRRAFETSDGTEYQWLENDSGTFFRRKRPDSLEFEGVNAQAWRGASTHRTEWRRYEGEPVTEGYKTTSGNHFQKVETPDGPTYFKNGEEVSRHAWSGGQRTLDYRTEGTLSDGEVYHVDKHEYSSYEYTGTYYEVPQGGVAFDHWDSDEALAQIVEIHRSLSQEPDDLVNVGVSAEVHETQMNLRFTFTPRSTDEEWQHRSDLYVIGWEDVVARLRDLDDDYDDVFINTAFTEVKA